MQQRHLSEPGLAGTDVSAIPAGMGIWVLAMEGDVRPLAAVRASLDGCARALGGTVEPSLASFYGTLEPWTGGVVWRPRSIEVTASCAMERAIDAWSLAGHHLVVAAAWHPGQVTTFDSVVLTPTQDLRSFGRLPDLDGVWADSSAQAWVIDKLAALFQPHQAPPELDAWHAQRRAKALGAAWRDEPEVSVSRRL